MLADASRDRRRRLALMPACLLFCTGLLAAGPAVTVVPVSGDPLSGVLTSLTSESVQIEADAGPIELPLDTLRSLTATDVEPPDVFADPPLIEVRLTDGSQLACTAFASQLDVATLTVEELGEVKLPRAAIRAVRLGSPEKIAPRWEDLLLRENSADMLVVRKQDALDFVDGAVGDVGPAEFTFLIQEQSRTLPRDRAFGIIYSRPAGEPPRPALTLHVGRSSLQLAAVATSDAGAVATFAAGPQLTVPVSMIRQIDFAGRIRFLGDLTPVVVLPEGVSADEQFRYFRRGSEPFGSPLRIGANEIITSEGLWMHSGVTARYRINRDYRRFVALVGMDHNVGGNRQVRLVILGDGRPLFDEIIAWAEPARELDLDVSGVRDLEIRVETPEAARLTNIFRIQEHLDLGNARLIR